jgi:hypothetical protein
MSKETNQLLGIKSTCCYGKVGENSKYYDMREELGKKILDYRLIKIKCQLKSNDSIQGIQFIYRNINTSQEVALINVKGKELNLIEQEMDFKMEEIVDLRIWLKDDGDFKLIGFEIKTSKGRIQKFGYGNDEQLRIIPDFYSKDQAIVGFGVAAEDEKGVTALYAYFLNKRTYAFYLYSGVISLRIKIKDEEFKKKINAKLPSMSEKNKILFRVCALPDNQFFNIIKFAVS